MAVKAGIKSIKKVEEVKVETPFPKLMVSSVSGMVIFFTSPQVGVVVVKGESDNNVGHKFNYWAMSCFLDYTAEVKKTKKKKKKKLPFPKLMIGRHGREIVHFSAQGKGTVVYVTEESTTSLHYTGTCWDMSHFKDFKGKLTLQNEQ
jgi:hypothetical protein